MSVNIVCFWWNDWCGDYGPEYVHNLHRSLKKYTTTPFNFYCFTDNPDALEVQTIYFEPKFKWNLNKLIPFDSKYNFTGRIITIDLDTVFLDYIDFILQDPDIFTTNESFGNPNECGGGIVSCRVDYGRKLYYLIKDNQKKIEKQTGGAERLFYRKYVDNPKFWQKKYSGIYSYKKHCQYKIPNDAKIIHCHGVPRTHEIPKLKEYWNNNE